MALKLQGHTSLLTTLQPNKKMQHFKSSITSKLGLFHKLSYNHSLDLKNNGEPEHLSQPKFL